MATKEVITYECDGCGKESPDPDVIVHHVVTVDRVTTEVDACAECWDRATEPLGKVLAMGRRLKATRRRRTT